MGRAWFDTKAIDVPLKGDADTMRSWLRDRHHYVVHSPTLGKWSKALKASSLKRALKNGHKDVEVFCYANPVRIYRAKTKSGGWDDIVACPVQPTNFVVDMDRVPGIGGRSPEERIASLRQRLERANVPLPKLIVESSPGSFHLVYLGTREGREWTKERREALCLRIAGAKRRPRTDKEMQAALAPAGIDLAYMRQRIDLAKFRLPGSVNVKKSVGKTDTSMIREIVRSHGWENKAFQYPTIEQLGSLDSLVPPQEDPASTAKTRNPEGWKRFMPELRAALSGHVPFAIQEELAKYLANNFNFLQKGKCRILQMHMAEALGVAQPTASRLIKLLITLGFLVKVEDAVRHKKAATYSSGATLRAAFERSLFRGRKYDFWEPYKDGQANDHFLRDVRVAARMGMTQEQIIAIIVEKQAMRPADRQRPPKLIARTFELWLNRGQSRWIVPSTG